MSVVFEVFDNGKKAENPPLWVHPTCNSFEKAVAYAKEWLGEYGVNCPVRPNDIVDYSGCNDTIEIRKVMR